MCSKVEKLGTIFAFVKSLGIIIAHMLKFEYIKTAFFYKRKDPQGKEN